MCLTCCFENQSRLSSLAYISEKNSATILINFNQTIFCLIVIDPFQAAGFFQYSLKTSKKTSGNLWFSNVSGGYRRSLVAWNGLGIMCDDLNVKHKTLYESHEQKVKLSFKFLNCYDTNINLRLTIFRIFGSNYFIIM